jgi:Flp pilus assembly pilin Flp
MKSTFKAPVEHTLLVFLFVVVWAGPVLKLFGIVHWSWWQACAVLEVIWGIALLVWIGELVKNAWARYANRLQQVPR